MSKLLSTTALVVALGFPAVTLAQSTDTATQSDTQRQNGMTSGFMAERQQSDIFASELIGHVVYARRAGAEQTGAADDQAATDTQQDTQDDQAAMDTEQAVQDDQAATDEQQQAQDDPTRMNGDANRAMATINRNDLEDMEQIGQINEIVLSDDGEVRALVIGVGGFLGMGEHDVAVTLDQVSFATDAEDSSEMYIMLHTSTDMLQDAPSYDRMATRGGETGDTQDRAQDQDGQMAATRDTQANAEGRTGFAAPDMQRDGYNRVEIGDVSTEMLMGQTVYDVADNDVGTVDDMILDEDGSITSIIIDFGGFLGIGSSQAAIGFDELTIMSDEGYSDVRIYVDATRDQIQELPRYSASN